MESVSGVSTRTEPTVSQAESSACQVQSEDLFATRELKEHDGPVNSVGCCPQVCPQQNGEVVRTQVSVHNTRLWPQQGNVMAL
ncbi:unnamed protein product [Durusdinium trenchii]